MRAVLHLSNLTFTMNIDTSFAGDFKGTFFTDAALMAERLKGIKAILFDWDGVFNNGHKTAEGAVLIARSMRWAQICSLQPISGQ